jgi:hypothetical protein
MKGHLQLAHLSDAPFEQFRSSIIFSVVLLSTLTLAQKFAGLVINIDTVILVLVATMVVGK